MSCLKINATELSRSRWSVEINLCAITLDSPLKGNDILSYREEVNMLSISQFAKECNTTIKTIRHYDNIGLLKADYISKESGYRYYRRLSVIKYNQIVKFKQTGFTLKEIKDIFEGFNISNILTHIEKKMLLLKKQQELCENMKKEYEMIMEETKKIMVAVIGEQINIISKKKGEQITFKAKHDIVNECAMLLDRALNEDQFIVIDFDDLKEIAIGKTVNSMGNYYSSNFDIEDFDNIEISRDNEKNSSMIVFFEASPDTSPEKICEAIDSFLMSFPEEISVLFSANLEHAEQGLNVQWIGLK